MQAHRMLVMVPEDHRTTIEFPETIRSGPVELIVLVPSEKESREATLSLPGHGRMRALAAELAQDTRPFRELPAAERKARLERVMGVGRGLMSTSDELAHRKLEEVELEERKFVR